MLKGKWKWWVLRGYKRLKETKVTSRARTRLMGRILSIWRSLKNLETLLLNTLEKYLRMILKISTNMMMTTYLSSLQTLARKVIPSSAKGTNHAKLTSAICFTTLKADLSSPKIKSKGNQSLRISPKTPVKGSNLMINQWSPSNQWQLWKQLVPSPHTS